MLEILIAEPNRISFEQLRKTLKEIFAKNSLSYRVTAFLNLNTAMQKYLESPQTYDIVIISTNNSAQARDFSEQIRKNSLKTAIVLSGGGYNELTALLRYRPSLLIHTDYNDCEIENEIVALYIEQYRYKKQKEPHKYFTIRHRDEIERIPHKDIDFFESFGRKISLYNNRDKKIYEFNAKMDDVIAAINSDNFVRCHQSYLINLENIRKIDKKQRKFITFSGKCIDISKRSAAEATKAFENYILH